MDFAPYLAAVVGALLGFLAWWFKQRKDHFSQFVKLGIPGPKPSLIWGNLGTILEKNHIGARKEWHKLYGPVIGYFFGYIPCLLIADRDLVKKILLNDFINFADRSHLMIPKRKTHLFPDLTALRGQRWRTVRSILTPSFTSSKLKHLAPGLASLVDDFTANVHAAAINGNEFDIQELYRTLTLNMICRSTLGIDFGVHGDETRSEILSEARGVLDMQRDTVRLYLSCFPWMMDRVERSLRRILMRIKCKGKNPITGLQERLRDIVKMRRINPGTRRVDLLQLMIDATGNDVDSNLHTFAAVESAEQLEVGDGGAEAIGKNPGQCPMLKGKGLTEDELIANALAVLLAGYESPSSALTFVTRVLIRFPDVQETVRQELLKVTDNGEVFDFERLQKCHYLEALIQETLRMYPPTHSLTSRIAAEEKTYNGITIPKGMRVFVSTVELHYDEEVFPDPHVFKPTRFLPENKTPAMNFCWQPFGAGPRNCIGMRFAQMQIKITLAKLLTKYRLVSDREPHGEIKIAVNVKPSLQDVKDPLLCRVELIRFL